MPINSLLTIPTAIGPAMPPASSAAMTHRPLPAMQLFDGSGSFGEGVMSNRLSVVSS
jgi:hypothetical protein